MTTIDDLMVPFLYQASKALDQLNYFDQVVEFDDDPGNVASSEATFVFSGPPVAKAGYTTSDGIKSITKLLKPIGAVQQINVQAGKQIIPFRELGSKLLRQAAGPTQYSGAMSRVLTRQNNLKYACYRWLFEGLLGDTQGNPSNSLSLARVPSDGNKQFIGLESEIYHIPFGILVLVGSAGGRVIQAEYLEKCHIVNDGSAKQVGNTLIVDNISFTVSRSIPFVHSSKATIVGETNLMRRGTGNDGIGMFDFTPSSTAPTTVSQSAAVGATPAA